MARSIVLMDLEVMLEVPVLVVAHRERPEVVAPEVRIPQETLEWILEQQEVTTVVGAAQVAPKVDQLLLQTLAGWWVVFLLEVSIAVLVSVRRV